MTTPASGPWQYLGPDSESGYLQLTVKGTGIPARAIYGMFMSAEEPMTPEEIAIAAEMPLEAVKEAIAYCQSNPPEIARDQRRDDALMEATGMNDPNYKYHGKPRRLSAEERARIDDL